MSLYFKVRYRVIGPLIRTVVRCVDSWLNYIRKVFPLSPRPRVLFQVANRIGFEAQAPVLRELQARRRTTLAVSSNRLTHSELQNELQLSGLGNLRVISPGVARHTRFDATVLTDSHSPAPWRCPNSIYLHHGTGFGAGNDLYCEKLWHSAAVNAILCLSDAERETLISKFGAASSDRFVVVGQPKLDAIVNSRPDTESYLRSLNLDPALPTVLIASHWTSDSLFQSIPVESFSPIFQREEINVLLTAHPNLFDFANSWFSGGIDWHGRLSEIVTGPNTRFIPEPVDKPTLLHSADLLVCDHSSIHVEYAVLNRPIAMFSHSDRPWDASVYRKLLRQTVMPFHDSDELLERVLRVPPVPSIEIGSRSRFVDYALSFLGNSADKAAVAIEQIAR